MRKLHSVTLAALLSGACVSVAAMDMAMMDSNHDSMISKQEFMKHHEAMWEKMKKNSKGMVAVKDMEMAMQAEMMQPDKPKGDMMMKDDKAMKGMKK
ncbi:MAG: hypothetical protein ABIN08_25900 [Caldimonas sp.]